MSKVFEAKFLQGYIEKPLSSCCSACKHFSSNIQRREGAFGSSWAHETNIRCSLGGFKVKKTARCDRFERSPPAAGGE